MGDFWPWVQAIAGQAWQFYGGFICVVVSIWEYARKSKFAPSNMALFAIGVLLFGWANFAAWGNEHREKLALQVPPPQVRGIIQMHHSGWTTSMHLLQGPLGKEQSFLLSIRIENDGAATVLHNWQVYYDVPGEGKIQGTIIPAPLQTIVFPRTEDDLSTFDIYSRINSIQIKTLEDPIERFHAKEGTIMVVFPAIHDVKYLMASADDRTGTTVYFRPDLSNANQL